MGEFRWSPSLEARIIDAMRRRRPRGEDPEADDRSWSGLFWLIAFGVLLGLWAWAHLS